LFETAKKIADKENELTQTQSVDTVVLTYEDKMIKEDQIQKILQGTIKCSNYEGEKRPN
jgi:hypothetical protein